MSVATRSHVCRATDRPIWSLNISKDKGDAASWTEHLGEFRAWLKVHNLDANNIVAAAVIRRGDGSKELHAREVITAECSDHDGHHCVDWTTDQVLSQLRVMPLREDPPSIPGTATW